VAGDPDDADGADWGVGWEESWGKSDVTVDVEVDGRSELSWGMEAWSCSARTSRRQSRPY
jgi:hypothetical protein